MFTKFIPSSADDNKTAISKEVSPVYETYYRC